MNASCSLTSLTISMLDYCKCGAAFENCPESFIPHLSSCAAPCWEVHMCRPATNTTSKLKFLELCGLTLGQSQVLFLSKWKLVPKWTAPILSVAFSPPLERDTFFRLCVFLDLHF